MSAGVGRAGFGANRLDTLLIARAEIHRFSPFGPASPWRLALFGHGQALETSGLLEVEGSGFEKDGEAQRLAGIYCQEDV